jgi:hypothetical protein
MEPNVDFNDDALAAKAAAVHYDAMFESQPAARRPLSRVLIMLLIFTVGAGAGLAGAWWMGTRGGDARAPASASAPAQPPAASPTAAGPTAEDSQTRAMRGIRASELPYDGEQPQAADAHPPTAAVTAPVARRHEVAPATAAKPEQAEQPLQAKTVKTPKPQAKPRSRISKDKEIERIRQQVDEELKKKNASSLSEARRNKRRQYAEVAATANRTARVQSIKAGLAGCDKRSNFILREQCRWHLCGGMWGRNGCPSYVVQRDPY